MTPAQRRRYQPRTAAIPRGSRERILAALPDATWDYDEDADELLLRFPGSAGREGRMVLIGDDFYVSFDVDTGAPLDLTVPAYTRWLARQLARFPHAAPARATAPAAVLRDAPDVCVQTVRSAVDASRALAAVG